ncbi:MAG: hypothetical protein OEW67_00390 [Cyclobacteriaceae bacterium]|nr:hypothetical protein [Cyclobacteriaceae bacterium]
MIEWLIVISLITFGIVLIVAEVIFVPGTTIVGVLGLVFLVLGVYKSFEYFNNVISYSILAGTSVLFVGMLYYVFTTRVWEKFSLKKEIKSKFNKGMSDVLSVGDVGKTISTLKPIGKAEFNNKVFEVKSLGGYVEPNNKVEIIKIENNQITIKQVNN